MVEALSWFGASLRPVVLGRCQNRWNYEGRKLASDFFHLAVASGKFLIGSGFIFQDANDPKHSVKRIPG